MILINENKYKEVNNRISKLYNHKLKYWLGSNEELLEEIEKIYQKDFPNPFNLKAIRYNSKTKKLYHDENILKDLEKEGEFLSKKSFKLNGNLLVFIKKKQKEGIIYKSNNYLYSKTSTDELSKLNAKFDKKEKLGQTFQHHWYDNKKNKITLTEKEFDELAVLIGDAYEKLADFKIKMSNKINQCKTESELNRIDFEKEWKLILVS